MADTKTNWILELIDKITAPMRNVTKAADETSEVIKAVTANIENMDDMGQKWAKHVVEQYKSASNDVSNLEHNVKKLILSLNDMGDSEKEAFE